MSMFEADVGILCYTTETPRLSAVLKHRYRDFQVREVDRDGHVAELTSVRAPAIRESSGCSLTSHDVHGVVEAFATYAGSENGELLKAFLAAQVAGCPTASSPSETPPQEVVFYPVAEKEQRKAMHEFLKTHPMLPPLVTTTVAAPLGSTQPPPGNPRCGGIRSEGSPGSGQSLQPLSNSTCITASPVIPCIKAILRDSQAGRHAEKVEKRFGRREAHGLGPSSRWQGGTNKFVKFILHKENLDTQAALGVLSRRLHLKLASFGFAGSKDKRAVTGQWVTAFMVPPETLAALNPQLRGIKVGDFTYCRDPLKLGQLKGNHFQVLMRNVTLGKASEAPSEYTLHQTCALVKSRGFINYFGLQRFGTGTTPTHIIGKTLLHGDWREATHMIMKGPDTECQDYLEARRRFFYYGDVAAGLRVLPCWMVAERAVLEGLNQAMKGSSSGLGQQSKRSGRRESKNRCSKKQRGEKVVQEAADVEAEDDGSIFRQNLGVTLTPLDKIDGTCEQDRKPMLEEKTLATAGVQVVFTAQQYCDALHGIPRTLRMMYLHAYQSYLWNHAASHRVQTYGVDRVVPGDLVLVDENGVQPSGTEEQKRGCVMEFAKASSSTVVPAAEDEGEDEATRGALRRLSQVHVVTEDDVAAGRFCILDVVLPVPGTKVIYPQHDTAKVYQNLVAQDGLSLNASPHRVRCFSMLDLTGDYRKVLHLPEDLRWSILRYTSPSDESLMVTDWEKLQLKQATDREGKPKTLQGGDHSSVPAFDFRGTHRKEPAKGGDNSAWSCMKHGRLPFPISEPLVGGAPELSPELASELTSGTEAKAALVALLLEFTLPPSCYATMLVRELTKMSTAKEDLKNTTMLT